MVSKTLRIIRTLSYITIIVFFGLFINFTYFSNSKILSSSPLSSPSSIELNANSKMTYGHFIEYLDMNWVKKVDFYNNDRIAFIQAVSPELGNRPQQIRVEIPAGASQLITKLRDMGIDFDSHITNQSKTDIYLVFLQNFVIILSILVFYFYIVRRQNQQNTTGFGRSNQMFNIGKSKNDFQLKLKTGVAFGDVAGIDEIKAEFEEIVAFLKRSEKYTKVGAKIPRGVLLVGPPGTGKTLLAKAIAGEAGVPFVSISGSEFVEMFIGVGASRVRDLFKNAKSKAPCLVFIDEIDAIGRQRGSGVGGSNDEREQTLNQLLTEMDGFSGNTGVIVIAATNRADVLDSALLRPGRFDRQITVNLPDSKGRLSILKVHARNKNFSLDVSLPTLAQRTIGFSGADLANILNESAILATRRKKQLISMAELDSALDRVIQGLQGTNLRDTRSKRLLAYHEVGHALTATLLPDHDPVDKVTIIPRGQTVGMTWFTPLEDYELISQEQILARLVVSLGGRAAEEIVFGTQEMTTTSGNDINRVTRTVRQMVTLYGMSNIAPMAFSVKRKPVFLTGRPMMVKIVHPNTAAKIDSAVQKIISYSYKQARILINENRNALNHLTNILVEREIVSGVEFREILEQYTQLPAKKAYLSYFSEKEEENKKLETDYI